MASLADATPSIALGSLDGRYRGVVAPLVDHLSEPALNRARVRVEVEWLIWLTTHEVGPGGPRPHRRRAGRAAPGRRRLRPCRDRGARDHRARDPARRQGRRVLPQAPPHAPSRPPPRTRASPSSSTSAAPARTSTTCPTRSWCRAPSSRSGCHAPPRLVEAVATMASDLRDVPLLAHTHGQPATPTTMGKELAVLAHRLGRQLRRIEGADYLGKLNGATGTYDAHLAAVPGGRLAGAEPRVRRVASAWSGTRSPPRSSRTTGRPSSTPTSRASTASCTTSAPTCGPTSRSATSPRSAARARSARRRCRTRSTRSTSRTPRPTSRSATRCSTSLGRDAGQQPAAARPHRLHDAAQHRRRRSATRCSPSTTPSAGLAGLDAVPGRHGRRPRRQLGGARRGRSSRRCAPWRAGRRRHGEPVRAAQGAHPRPPDHRRRPARVRRAASACPTTSRPGCSAMTPATYIGAAPELVDFLD